jgi:hypothetical protein
MVPGCRGILLTPTKTLEGQAVVNANATVVIGKLAHFTVVHSHLFGGLVTAEAEAATWNVMHDPQNDRLISKSVNTIAYDIEDHAQS